MSVAPAPKSTLVALRNAFFSGVLLLAPLVVTIWAFGKIIDAVGGTFRPLYEHHLPESLQDIPLFWDLAATLVVVGLVTLLGFLSHYVLGRFFVSMGERFVQNIPGIGAVYNSVKQIVATFGSERKNLFSKVVLVQFPRAGAWTLGFLTNKTQGEAQAHAALGPVTPHPASLPPAPPAVAAPRPEIWTVFVPTSPNPTSGFLIMIPRQEVVELEMTVGDGMKMIISGGAVMPPWPGAQPIAIPAHSK